MPHIRDILKIPESAILKGVIDWCELHKRYYPGIDLIYHIPNEGKRHPGRAKAEGIKAGIPDLCLPVSRRGYGAFYLELKKVGDTPTAKQTAMMDRLTAEGNYAAWTDSDHKAIALLKWYYSNPKN